MQLSLIYIYLVLAILGLCFGSFACATLWRLRSKQLIEEKEHGHKVKEGEYKRLLPLSKSGVLNDYSRCLDCSYRLKWYDLIPLLSWILLGGKCRKCRKPIGALEPLMELGMMAFFILSFIFWPYTLNNYFEIARFILWLIAGVGLMILFVYDQIWSILPDRVNFIVIGIGLVNAIFVVLVATNLVNAAISVVFSVGILSGVYWIINKISSGKWVGYGDVKLGLGLALLLADWRLAFIALFAANLSGSLIVIPLMLTKKLKRNSKVPFGPLLIGGFIFAALFGKYIISTYFYGLI